MDLFGEKKAIASLHNRLLALEESHDALLRQNKSLRLEWEELYDKVRHQMSRMSKRVSTDSKLNEQSPESLESPEQFQDRDPISRSILLRRARQSLPRS